MSNSFISWESLLLTADKAKVLLALDVIEVVVDKGYDSRKDIMDCVNSGIIPNVPFPPLSSF